MANNTFTSSFGDITLEVSPEQLNSTAENISNKINNVNNLFADISKKKLTVCEVTGKDMYRKIRLRVTTNKMIT